MHPSIHPYILTSIHPHIHTSTHPHIHTSTHPHIHTSTHPHIHTSIHPYIHIHIHAYRAWACIDICMNACTFAHTCRRSLGMLDIQTCMHTYTYMHTYLGHSFTLSHQCGHDICHDKCMHANIQTLQASENALVKLPILHQYYSANIYKHISLLLRDIKCGRNIFL